MAAINFLKSGFNQAISKFRLSVYLWLLIMAISLIIIIPISSQIRANLGHLSWSEKPLMPFELNLMEIFLASQNFLASYIIFLLIMLLFSVALSIFFRAGLFGQMLSQERSVTFRSFLADGCRYFCRFLLSLLLFIPFLLIFILLFNSLSAPLKLWSARAVSEWPVILAGLLCTLLLALLWTAFKLLLDLVRIFIVAESKKVIAAYASAFRFLSRHFFRLWGLYLQVSLAVIIISAIWLLISRLFSPTQPGSLFILILLGQAYILFRLFARQVFIAVEYSYFSTRKDS